ncbi:MAG TPA: caspase family protein [Mycobacteriales bacterium]|nr:caspase family protein [Mycobacteriales bacterium]
MRRIVTAGTLVSIALATVLPLSAGAATDRSRTVTETYSEPGGLTSPFDAPVIVAPGPWVTAGPGENKARVVAADATGAPVALAVDYVPAHQSDTVTRVFCSTSGWLRIKPGSRLRAETLAGSCPSGAPSVPTSGRITTTLTQPVRVPVTHNQRAVVPPSGRWAVVVGIQHYQSPTEPTYGGDGDATAVRKALLHAGWLSSHIRMVRDGQATGAGIVAAMRWLVAHSGPHTFTLFHYSGHVCIASRGPCASGHTYLWSSDNRFLSETAVAGVLSRLRGHAWIDIAGCEAGAFDRHLHSRLRIFTGSSQPARTSYEEPRWHESVWTGFTWDHGFNRGAATGGQRYAATMGQMIRYGVRHTKSYTQNAQAGQQNPYYAGGSGHWRLSAPPG